jgi:hypothetical protein
VHEKREIKRKTSIISLAQAPRACLKLNLFRSLFPCNLLFTARPAAAAVQAAQGGHDERETLNKTAATTCAALAADAFDERALPGRGGARG